MRNLVRKAWWIFARYILAILPDRSFHQFMFWVHHRRFGRNAYRMNFDAPATFNEKINFLKMYERHPGGKIIADKLLAREYVQEKIGAEYLVPLLSVYDSAADIDPAMLPAAFVLKANHGSGNNLIIKNKSAINWKQAKKKLRSWLLHDHWPLSREWQYVINDKKIICEQFLGTDIPDYKIFCCNGEAAFIQVDIDRFQDHKRILLELEWKPVDLQFIYPVPVSIPPKPAMFDTMINLARKLSIGWKFLRVDFYVIEDKIYFGEMTLHPEGGYGPFASYEQDLLMGTHIKLS
jgi:hypothetical protein